MKKAITITLLSLPLLLWAAINESNELKALSFPIEIMNDTTIVSTQTLSTYKNVDVEIEENDKATTIRIYRDNDTLKQYQMNFDFSQDTSRINKDDNCSACTKEKHNDKSWMTWENKKDNNRFKGHWAGVEMGLNNYLTNDMSTIPDESYMEINTGKSWNFNINFAQVSLPIYRDRIGLVSGLGIEWNNYHFKNNNTIEVDPSSNVIVEKPIDAALKKNRLQTTYLTVPLLLEGQIGQSRHQRVSISAGVICGLKLGSHTKYKTSDGKEKNKDDFYLQSFRYGYTARVSYKSVGIYANYYNTPLFIDGKGPDLYPYSAGVTFSFN